MVSSSGYLLHFAHTGSEEVLIGDDAFRLCSGLMAAIFLGDAPEIGDDAFSDVDPGFTFYYLNSRSGFSSQSWQGHPTIRIDEALQISATFSISFTPDGLRLMLPPIGRLGPLVLPLVNFDRDIGVEYSPDLLPGSWIELGNFFETQGTWVFTDPDLLRLARPSGFYRAFLRPPPP